MYEDKEEERETCDRYKYVLRRSCQRAQNRRKEIMLSTDTDLLIKWQIKSSDFQDDDDHQKKKIIF